MKVWALCIKKGCASVLTQPLFNVFTKNRIMIVENMSIEEMQIEVEKDSDILYAKIRHLYDDI